jgi:nitroreductase
MENKYFISFNIPREKLQNLDELALLAQIMFWAHDLDKSLSSRFTGGKTELLKKLSLLSLRTDAYKKKYAENCVAYKWGLRIKELCNEAIYSKTDYQYPFARKMEINIPNSELDNLIKGRRSIRAYTGEGISNELIMKILEYASWAPNSCNNQALRYCVIQSKRSKAKIKRSGIDIEHSACVIAVLADLRLYSDLDIECACHDSGAAIQNILLACHYFGLGACYISDKGLDSDSIRSLIPVHEYEKVTALVSIGHYDKLPIIPERIEIKKIVRFC